MKDIAYEISKDLAEELGQHGPKVLPRLVAEYLDVRDQSNAIDARRKKLNQLLQEALEEAGGEYIDEASGQKVYLDKQPRWEYDPKALHGLVESGVLRETEFAACLETVVDKSVVQGWLDRGLVTDRQITLAAAKRGTRIVRQIKVAPVGRRRG